MTNFEIGQIWSYDKRDNDDKSDLIILLIEIDDTSGESIVHIAVRSVCINGYYSDVDHLPFSYEAFRKSVIKLESKNGTLPDYKEGYDIWRKEQGGVWAISIKEVIQYIEDTESTGL